jgi:hypothetical protein
VLRVLQVKKCPIVIALSEAMPEGLYGAKRNEAITNPCDCFTTLRFARNDNFWIIYFVLLLEDKEDSEIYELRKVYA